MGYLEVILRYLFFLCWVDMMSFVGYCKGNVLMLVVYMIICVEVNSNLYGGLGVCVVV